MQKRLSEEQVAQFERDGYVFGVDVFTPDEVASYRSSLEAVEAAQGGPLKGPQKSKTYLLYDWYYEMVTHPNVLDAVEDLIGPNILVFYGTSWLKPPSGKHFVSWHQDATYFGLEPANLVTGWLGLTASTPETGCVQVLPGTQTLGQLKSDAGSQSENNLLSSGQRADIKIDHSKTVSMTMAPGQMSLHHTNLVHGSEANTSNERRLGICVHFIPTDSHQVGTNQATALLVRGTNDCGNFKLEAPPVGNGDPVSLASHAEAMRLARAAAEEQGNTTTTRND